MFIRHRLLLPERSNFGVCRGDCSDSKKLVVCTSERSVVTIGSRCSERHHLRDVFEEVFEQVRRWYGFYICGDVVMPEHAHLLIREPERGPLSLTLQMVKQNVARELRLPEGSPFWTPRYYDFNIWGRI